MDFCFFFKHQKNLQSFLLLEEKNLKVPHLKGFRKKGESVAEDQRTVDIIIKKRLFDQYENDPKH